MNKKGVSEIDKQVYWLFIVLPVLLFVVGILLAWTLGLKNSQIPQGLVSSVYESRLLYSGSCFAYVDSETQRVYPGIIDPNKFTNTVLTECVPAHLATENALRVQLSDESGERIGDLKTKNWNSNSEKSIIVDTYVVNIFGKGKGLVVFYNKE